MRISKISIKDFRRFKDLKVDNIPQSSRLVVLAGPNGCGKSSLFDAFAVSYRALSGYGWSNDRSYYARDDGGFDPNTNISIEVHEGKIISRSGSFYFRSAYRNEPEFSVNSLGKTSTPDGSPRIYRMIDADATVNLNFQRLASQAMEDIFTLEDGNTTISEFRKRVVGDIDKSINNIFSDLNVNSIGNPLQDGTFTFKKGIIEKFNYKNLSGGEKSAFDLVLDIIVRRSVFNDSVYCIDEPETHMNTRLQAQRSPHSTKLQPASGLRLIVASPLRSAA